MPTYNEAGNIADLMREAVAQVRSCGVGDIEVIVADDDSPDLTWQIAAETDCPGASVTVLRRMENHGLTVSLNDAINAAKNEVIVWFDCDFSQSPERIPQLLEKIREGFDVAVNSRYLPGGGENRSGDGSAIHLFLSKWLNYSLRHLLDPAFSKHTSGFIDLIYRILLDGRFKVVELPYVMQPRRSGVSKTGTNLWHYLSRGRKYLSTILALRKLRAKKTIVARDH